jgi:hypothetical protein
MPDLGGAQLGLPTPAHIDADYFALGGPPRSAASSLGMEQYVAVEPPGLDRYEADVDQDKSDWQVWRVRRGGLTPVRLSDPPMAMAIEDDYLARQVVARMVAAGVEVVERP